MGKVKRARWRVQQTMFVAELSNANAHLFLGVHLKDVDQIDVHLAEALFVRSLAETHCLPAGARGAHVTTLTILCPVPHLAYF